MVKERAGDGLHHHRIECLSQAQLAPILERKRNPETSRKIPGIPLDALLINILEKANEFVPSASGSILLDDPILKLEDAARKELIFVCCFGPAARSLVGQRIPVDRGIVGTTYHTGISGVSNDACRKPEFAARFDRKLGFSTKSVLCVAIRIGRSICGVIELMNRRGRGGYSAAERELLEIFAQYISSTIQNALDAKKIENMVRLDDLTGLSNDRYLHERLPVEVETHLGSRRPLSVIFLDLDRFKEINDAHGHLAGSTTLAEFGRLLRSRVRRKNATLVRYGGDEFVVLLPATDAEEALAIAERIRAATAAHTFLSAPWGEEERPLHLGGIITASIGVSTMAQARRGPIPGEHMMHVAMKLLQAADQAMYVSKARGKNVVTALPFALPNT